MDETGSSGLSPIGRRIHITGNSCSGKSTLGERLAKALAVSCVELDALNWQPNWVGLNATDPEKFERLIAEATASDGWVVAGSYMNFCQKTFWSRLETVIWLDLPLPQLVRRVLKRSWRRWRSKELLWGTNYEQFWPQLMIWRKEKSLLWWIVTQYKRKRQAMLKCMADPRWSYIRFVRLTSVSEIEEFARLVEASVSGGDASSHRGSGRP
jgi:adenylate kinase family enzyme